MRLGGIAALSVVLVLPLVGSAVARPVTLGAGIGVNDSERDWDDEGDDTVQIFGRVGLTSRVAGQLEVQKIEMSQSEATVRSGTALIVVELGSSGRLVPTMFAGLGLDRGETPYGASEEGSHIEGGFGLEYRVDGGLVISGDVRLGGRSVENEDDVILDAGVRSYYAPLLVEGEYRSLRVGVGIRF
jgi:hypothetical protein